MSFSVGCRGCGLEYSGRRPFAQRRNLVRPALPRCSGEIGRWLRTARRSLDEADYEQHTLEPLPRARRLLASASGDHFLVPLTSALWSTAPGPRARVPRRLRDPLLRQPRHARLRALPLADRRRRQPARTSTRDRRPARPRLHVGLGVRTLAARRRRRRAAHRRRRSAPRSTRSSSPRMPTRRSRCSPTRATRSGGCSAPSATRGTRPCSTRTQRSCRAPAAARAAWNFHSPTATRRTGDPTITYSLNRLQRARGRRGVLRDAEPRRRDRPEARDRAA